MEKIPTVEEFLKQCKENLRPYSDEMVLKLFAKIHVEAALKAAEEEAANSDLNTGQLNRILNAYPLTNIK